MAVVEKLFRMAADGLGTWKIQASLHAAGVPAPMGGQVWDINVTKRLILNDLYKPHTCQEMAELLGPEALARLEPGGLYGVQWHNRRKTATRTVSEPVGNGGRIYRRRRTTKERPREEWIAVPVPAPIPPAVAEAARRAVGESRPRERKYLTREWELRGLLRCPCGASMRTQTTNPHNRGLQDASRADHAVGRRLRHEERVSYRRTAVPRVAEVHLESPSSSWPRDGGPRTAR